MKIDSTLYRGTINKNLRVTFSYKYESSGNFQTIIQKNDIIYLNNSFSITIGGKYGEDRVFIPSSKYYQFIEVLNKTVKSISEDLYKLFPNIGKMEFEMDQRALDTFKLEKAVSSCGIAMEPAIWVDQSESTFPGIKISGSVNDQTVVIPFEDSIPMLNMLSTFDPQVYGVSLLRILGKID